MPVYEYKHPETGEIFEVFRKMSDSGKSFIAPDGVSCKKIVSSFAGWKEGREVFEVDRDYVKRCNPKKVKFRDGHSERYDPTKHC
jgi:hypothetical protein